MFIFVLFLHFLAQIVIIIVVVVSIYKFMVMLHCINVWVAIVYETIWLTNNKRPFYAFTSYSCVRSTIVLLVIYSMKRQKKKLRIYIYISRIKYIFFILSLPRSDSFHFVILLVAASRSFSCNTLNFMAVLRSPLLLSIESVRCLCFSIVWCEYLSICFFVHLPWISFHSLDLVGSFVEQVSDSIVFLFFFSRFILAIEIDLCVPFFSSSSSSFLVWFFLLLFSIRCTERTKKTHLFFHTKRFNTEIFICYCFSSASLCSGVQQKHLWIHSLTHTQTQWREFVWRFCYYILLLFHFNKRIPIQSSERKRKKGIKEEEELYWNRTAWIEHFIFIGILIFFS